MISRAFLPLITPGLLLSGCAAPASYPSLLPRPAESQSLEEPTPPAPQASAPDPALDQKLGEAMRVLSERTSAFDAASSRAERAITAARGAAAGSEAWLDAQIALAELDALRAATSEITTTLEDLASERALSLQREYEPLVEAVDRVRAAGQRQSERILALQSRLAPA